MNVSELSSCHIILDAVAFDDGLDYNARTSLAAAPRLRKVLHVQGRSYWAAANIGPYSQSVNAQGRITIAGQIGLLPATLQLASPPSLEIALSLQHARRVFKATLENRVEKHKGWIEGCICWIDDVRRLAVARSAWQAQSIDTGDEQSDGDEELGWEAEWLGAGISSKEVPITFIVLPKGALPRSACVEWQLFAHDGQAVASPDESDDDDNDDGEAPPPAISAEANGTLGGFDAEWKIVSSKQGASTLGIMHLNRASNLPSRSAEATPHHLLSKALTLKVLYHQQEDLDMCECRYCCSSFPC
jgi:diphthine-ammonia ligase